MSVSPDGKTLATGSGDWTVRLWDVTTKKLTATLKGHTGSVYAVAFSPDGETIASGSGDETVELMAKLIFLPIAEQIESGTYLLYDGACGTGGMLTVAEDTLTELAQSHGKQVATHLYGQEINAETYAICKADLLLKGEGEAADNIIGGAEHSTLSNDAFRSREFDFMLSNPPYGKSWKSDQERMGGKSSIKDTRFVIEHNGDPEFSLVTRSSDGQVQLIDATKWFKPLRKNMGKKNCEFADDDIQHICDTFLAFKETEESKIFPNSSCEFQSSSRRPKSKRRLFGSWITRSGGSGVTSGPSGSSSRCSASRSRPSSTAPSPAASIPTSDSSRRASSGWGMCRSIGRWRLKSEFFWFNDQHAFG